MLDEAPARLRALAAACPDTGPGLGAYMAVLVGWDEQAGRVVGYTLGSADGFRPVEMTDSYATTPLPSPADPDYPRLHDLNTRAGKGREAAKAFLVAASRAQLRAFGRGLYGGGVAFGGPPRPAEVTERGVECRKVGEA